MLSIGLTGGIGAGKTTVANLFAAKGANIIDADMIARQVTSINKPAHQAIIQHFGASIKQASGELDRSQLRKIIFENAEQRHWLENLLHPLILDEIAKQCKQETMYYHVVVIPLLFESGPHAFLDRILLVDCPEDLQTKRAATRDQSQPAQIQTIMNTQMPRDERYALADDIILNDGDLESLSAQVDRLHAFYLELAH